MGLRETAARHNQAILNNSSRGFGWPISVISPDGVVGNLTGFSDDISQIIDPDTGGVVSGRRASVAIHTQSLAVAGVGVPIGIADAKSKPWIIEFLDVAGAAYRFKVSSSDPDRTLGMIVLLLEPYNCR